MYVYVVFYEGSHASGCGIPEAVYKSKSAMLKDHPDVKDADATPITHDGMSYKKLKVNA